MCFYDLFLLFIYFLRQLVLTAVIILLWVWRIQDLKDLKYISLYKCICTKLFFVLCMHVMSSCLVELVVWMCFVEVLMFPWIRLFVFVCVLQSLCVRISLHGCQVGWLYSLVLQCNNPWDTISDMIPISSSKDSTLTPTLTISLLLKTQHIWICVKLLTFVLVKYLFNHFL